MRHTLRTFLTVALSTVALSACSDSPVGKSLLSVTEPSQVIVDPAVLVDVLRRTAPLRQDINVSATISRTLGGTIEIPEADFKLEVPAYAFPQARLTITVRALAGNAVAYEFGPHGTTFDKPLVVKQLLRYTEAFHANRGKPIMLEAAYFKDNAQLSVAQGIALVNEILPTMVTVRNANLTFQVEHFSGYLVSSGRR